MRADRSFRKIFCVADSLGSHYGAGKGKAAMCFSGNGIKPRIRAGKWMDPVGETDLASIIIPTYNRAELLDETLASAVAQSYRPLEIIVVDDGSTDDTAEAVDRWGQAIQDEPEITLRYIRQRNSGVGCARNRGLIESRGEFIQFLDSDDILNNQKLALQIDCLRRYPESGMAISDMANIDDPDKWEEVLSVDWANQADSAEHYCNSRILTMVGVYRRGICHAAGPWAEDISLGEDEEYGLRALLATPRLVYLHGNLCAFRDHPGPRLTDPQKDHRGLIFAMRAYRRMAESAAEAGRMDDPRLVAALARRLNGVILPALMAGRHELADEAIRLARCMPIRWGRRARLAVYEFFNHLPGGIFSFVWPVWVGVRHAVFEIPYREMNRMRERRVNAAAKRGSVIAGR